MTQPDLNVRAENERTLSDARLCAVCDTPIGRRRPQARFCSDVCRARARRQDQHARAVIHLDAITRAVEGLRRELGLSPVVHGIEGDHDQEGSRDE